MKRFIAPAFLLGLAACSGEASPTSAVPTPKVYSILEPQAPPPSSEPEKANVSRTVQRSQYRLLDQLVWGGLPIELTSYDADVRTELEAFQRRYDAYSAQREIADNGVVGMVAHAHVRYERRLAAASTALEASELARAYVSELRPCYEWEGFSDCPEREARFAADYRKAHPDSPFRDYLPLLEAHRWLCAAEGYDYEASAEGFEHEKAASGAASSRESYKSALSAALESQSLLVRVAATELAARNRCHEGG